MSPPSSLLDVVSRALRDLRAASAPAALVGGLAVGVHVLERATRDADFAVAVASDAEQSASLPISSRAATDSRSLSSRPTRGASRRSDSSRRSTLGRWWTCSSRRGARCTDPPLGVTCRRIESRPSCEPLWRDAHAGRSGGGSGPSTGMQHDGSIQSQVTGRENDAESQAQWQCSQPMRVRTCSHPLTDAAIETSARARAKRR